MSDTLHAALVEAIEDEYRARARYAAAIAAFGPIRPFVPILEAEGRHVAALAGLFARYGFALPPDLWAGRVSPPASVAETCRQGVAAEIANARMCDRLIARVDEPDARRVFGALRSASRDSHLAAFEARLRREETTAPRDAPESMGAFWSFALGLAAGAAVVRS